VPKKVLVILSHPYIQYSFTHQHLAKQLENISNVTVRHIDQLPRIGDHFDHKFEQALWDDADTIVLEFPMYWYHGPASLKQYLDDVLTTGATANECAAALKKAGAKKVYVLAVARTLASD
jgi:putative NADPH-quinone reductase